MNKKVEIIMPSFNRRELTLQCLRSITRIDRTGIDVHAIVVDDASTDGTREAILEQFPDVEVISTKGDLWFNACTNLGITAALNRGADYVLCCCDDSIFEENSVRSMVECAEKYPRSVIGALLLEWDAPHKVFQVAPEWQLKAGGLRHWRHQTVWTIPQKPWEVELIVGNGVLYPAEVIRELGLMDEKRSMQYGDAEYTPRMRRNGWRLLMDPRARMFCQPNTMPPRLRRMSFTEKVRALFAPSSQPHSLFRRIHMTLMPAPNLFKGLLAIPIFYARAAVGKNYEGAWGFEQKEKPLSELFAHKVVKD